MRVNLQTSPYSAYRAYNNSTRNIVSFQNKRKDDCGKEGEKPDNILFLQNPKTDEFLHTNLEDKLDEAYEEGYRDGKKFKGLLMGSGMILILIMQALGIYNDYEMQNSLMEYQNLQTEGLERQIEILSQDMELNHKIIIEALARIMVQLDELSQQKNNLIEQINALPEDSEEAQALKEELSNIQERFDILNQQYQDYMSELYNNKEEEGENKKDNPAIPHNGPVIPV